MQLIDLNEEEKQFLLECTVSKGTYIRSLCETIAEKLNTVGYMKELNRIKVGEFTLGQAIDIRAIETSETMKQAEKNQGHKLLERELNNNRTIFQR